MKHVEKRFGSNHGLVAAALVVGVGLGLGLFSRSEPVYGFVSGAEPIRIAEFRSGSSSGTLRVYNLRDDWERIVALVQREAGQFVSKNGTFRGLPAKTVVVPQIQSGRANLFETPVREITIVQGRFVRDKSGREVAMTDEPGWAGVRVLEYRSPRFLDQAAEWLRDRVRV